MSSTPLVSVVTPFYNEETYLAECIESVLSQEYTHFELILVDNMSTVTNGGTECIGYGECAALILDGEDVNYQGASGVVDLNDVGEPTAGTYDVYEYDAEGNANTEFQVTFSNA